MLSHTKHVQSGECVQDMLLNGVNTLANAVTSTLGPKGRNVLIETEGLPRVSKDGVTVANSIHLNDAVENMACQLIKQAASETVNQCGDGTTTSTLLAQHLYERASKETTDPYTTIRKINKDLERILPLLEEKAFKIDTDNLQEFKQRIYEIAFISANQDDEIAGLIQDAILQSGKDGLVSIESANEVDSKVVFRPGFQFKCGPVHPYLQGVLKRPLVALIPDVIETMRQAEQLIELLTLVAENNRSLLIVCDDIVADPLATLIVNVKDHNLIVSAMKIPGWADQKKENYKDLAALTGATIKDPALGDSLKISLEDLGTIDQITLKNAETTFVGSNNDLTDRIDELTEQLKTATEQNRHDLIQHRIAKLKGGVSTIAVGGLNEADMMERRDRVEDALHAVRAALDKGICPGGGTHLLKTTQCLDPDSILKHATEQPFKQILRNAGKSEEEIETIKNKLLGVNPPYELQEVEHAVGFDPITETYQDFIEYGIIDPVKVTITALENAVGAASILLTASTTVTGW